MSRSKRGQSVLEYVVVLTAIIAIIVLAANGVIRDAVDKAMKDAARSITNASGRLP